MGFLEKLKVIDATPIGDYAFYGDCVVSGQFRYETVSVGIFQVVEKRSGGKKALPAIARIKGYADEPKLAHCAEYICRQLNSRKYADLAIKDRVRRIKADYVNLHGKVM